ncbi:MAG TPA: sialidase family protein [Polyangium sp.]|nr:sialidase family protein [Polyangium sp.]
MFRTTMGPWSPTAYALTLALSLLPSCAKKKEDAPIAPPPPPRGAASLDQLSTGLGTAKGLDASLAPPSMNFDHVLVLDDKRAILAGGVPGSVAIALMTVDAGKTWKAFRTDRDTWSSYAFGTDGMFALALGPKETAAEAPPAFGKKAPPPPPFQFFFAGLDAPSFGTATMVDQPPLARKPDPKLPLPKPRLALLDKETASLVVEPTAKKFVARYVAPPGTDAPAEVVLPKLETFATGPVGRPPRLFSVKGRELLSRKWPAPGEPIGEPEYVAAVKTTTTLVSELSASSACDVGSMSYQAITQPPTKQNPNKNYYLVVTPDRLTLVPRPVEALSGAAIGCNDTKFVVEAPDADKQSITLLLCDLEGKCTTPTRPVFKPWIEKHEREIVAVPTSSGAAAVMSAQAGERWGLYYAQSTDGGKFYERARIIGEGTGARGRVDFGALVSFGKRTLLIVSADVTGTSRRGFYVLVSDDDGATWNPP